MQSKRSNSNKTRRASSGKRLLTVAPFVLVAVGAAVVGAFAHVPHGQVAPGTHVADLDLGDKPLADARLALQQWAEKRQSVTFTLRLPAEMGIRRVWKPDAHKLGLGLDVQGTLTAVDAVGHTSVLGQVSHWVSGSRPIQIPARTVVDSNRLRAYLKQIAHEVNRHPKNASIIAIPGGGFGLHHETNGLSLDVDASEAAIVHSWNDFNSVPTTSATTPASTASPSTPPSPGDRSGDPNNATSTDPKDPNAVPSDQPGATPPNPSEPGASGQTGAAPSVPEPDAPSATISLRIARPPLTIEDLKQIDCSDPMGQYTTYFGGTGQSRGSNIALAARHINGTMLQPGEIFSYNKVVGPRDEEAGFRTAPVIVHGELVPGLGGGICQVSSTLYNAVLLSDLKIVQRSHHAFPVHYLPAGRDATCVYGEIDFKFQNDTPAPVYISTSSHGGRLSMRIFGKKTPDKKVSIELSHHSIQYAGEETESDPSLPAGRHVVKSPGHNGHHVTVYRIVRENGQVVKRELISHDYYQPVPAIVLVGTRSRPHPVHKAVRPVAPAAPAPTPPAPAAPFGAPPVQ